MPCLKRLVGGEIKVYRDMAKCYEELNLGDTETFEVHITEEMHKSFAELFKDYSPIHTDDSFAETTPFGKRIGYAFMLTGYLSRLYGEYLPGGSSICIKQDAKFIKPFYIGDKLSITGTVSNKIDSTRFVEIESVIYRNDNECVYKGSGIVQLVFEYDSNTPLYEHNSQLKNKNCFIKALKELGVHNGDLLFVHSDISVFGKLATKDKEKLLKALTESITETVSDEGTVIMPAFSYSFTKNEPFDLGKTRSTVGILTEYFRNRSDVVRTKHPIFSVAIWGKLQEQLFNTGKDSFGEDSIFEKLHENKGKLIFFGAPFQSCTYLHYIEQAYGVPYRYIKTFKGTIIDGDEEYEDECTFFVRDLDKNVQLDTTRLEKHLLDSGLMKCTKVGGGNIMVIDAGALYDEGFKLLKKDLFFFLKEEV